MEPYILSLPVPPTLSEYYENRKGVIKHGPKAGKTYMGRMISEEGNRFRTVVIARARAGHRAPPKLSGSLSIVCLVQKHPKTASGAKATNRKGDLDNRFKALLDALTNADVILDDVLFDDIRMIRGNPIDGGRATLIIRRFEPAGVMAEARALGLMPPSEFGELPF